MHQDKLEFSHKEVSTFYKSSSSCLNSFNSSNSSTDEWIKAWQESEESGQRYNNSLLDNSIRTSTQVRQISDLKYVAGNKNAGCGSHAVWHKIDKYYIRLPCKKWTCPDCGKKNALKLEKRLAQSEVNDWKVKRHIILTVAEDSVISNLSELLNDFTTDLRRGSKKLGIRAFPNLKLFWVKEFQEKRFFKSGVWWRHIHMVVNVAISKYDVIPYWNKANKNKFNMVEVRSVRSFNKGSYLTKYFTKEQYQGMFDLGERRYGASKGVLPKILVKASSGDFVCMTLEEARNLYSSYQEFPDMEISWLQDEEG